MGSRAWFGAGSVLAVALLAAPAAVAVPHCYQYDEAFCNVACDSRYGSTCSSIPVGPCSSNTAQVEIVCETGQSWVEACSDCSSGGGCFLAGTLITMADGSRKPIEKITPGDVVLAYDETTGEMKPDTVREVHDPVTWEFYLVVNETLRLTPVHPVLSDGRWVEIGDLKPGAELTAENGSAVEIETIRRVDEPVTVYNFAVNPYGTYVANGIIVHNKKKPEDTLPPDP